MIDIKKVLLIEPDNNSVKAYFDLIRMEKLNYRTEVSTSFESAEEKIELEEFDIVITEFKIMNKSSLDLITRFPDLPFIVVTARENDDREIKSLKAGAFYFLLKDNEFNCFKKLPLLTENAVEYRTIRKHARNAEVKLKKYQNRMEEIVELRTKELTRINLRLKDEIKIRKDIERELQHSLSAITSVMEGSIQMVGAISEMRDTYTAGHQRRVAHLAKSIAQKMELPENQIEGINMAGLLHDLGKISIPSEILAKPGKLSDLEFNLIKNHVNTGYNILKLIDFPWPLAEIVLQHHERIDGSGYLKGLAENEIMIEAKIISVADTVEALSSHRPYRPGKGIKKALQEISVKNKEMYDQNIVAVCLDLFLKEGYNFVEL